MESCVASKSANMARVRIAHMGTIAAIWIKPASGAPMKPVDEADLVAGRGLKGNADQGGWRQVTIIDEKAWHDAEAELGKEFDPSHRRANVMLRRRSRKLAGQEAAPRRLRHRDPRRDHSLSSNGGDAD